MKNLPVTSKRCLELAHTLLDGSTGLKLDMGLYINSCGTAGCVAGHAVFLYDRALFNRHRFQRDSLRPRALRNRAQELLGLTDRQSRIVFTCDYQTPEWAAKKLEQFAMENAA